MEIAQLCKSTCYNQLQQSIYLCHRRNMSQVLQVKSLAEPTLKVKASFTPTPPSQFAYQVSAFYTLRNPRNNLDKILKLMVTMKRSYQDYTMMCCTHTTPNQCPYNVSTSHTLQLLGYSPTRYYRSRSLQQGQIKIVL